MSILVLSTLLMQELNNAFTLSLAHSGVLFGILFPRPYGFVFILILSILLMQELSSILTLTSFTSKLRNSVWCCIPTALWFYAYFYLYSVHLTSARVHRYIHSYHSLENLRILCLTSNFHPSLNDFLLFILIILCPLYQCTRYRVFTYLITSILFLSIGCSTH